MNIISIIAATFAGMVLGALWYSPVLFGNRWMKCLGKTPETLGGATGPMIGAIVANLLTAIGVSLVFSLTGVDTLVIAIGTGLLLGLLIIFPAMLSDNLFCGWGNELLLIQSGYRVVTVLLMSVVLYYLG